MNPVAATDVAGTSLAEPEPTVRVGIVAVQAKSAHERTRCTSADRSGTSSTRVPTYIGVHLGLLLSSGAKPQQPKLRLIQPTHPRQDLINMKSIGQSEGLSLNNLSVERLKTLL